MSVWGCHGIQGTFKRRTCYCNHSALNLPLLKDTWQRCIDLCCAALLCNPSTGSSLYEDTSSLSRLAYQVPVPNLPTVTPPFYKVVFQWHYSFIKGLSKHTHLSKHYLIKCITSPAGTMLTSFSVFPESWFMLSLKDNLFPMHCGTAPLARAADDASCTLKSTTALKECLFQSDSLPYITHQCTVFSFCIKCVLWSLAMVVALAFWAQMLNNTMIWYWYRDERRHSLSTSGFR